MTIITVIFDSYILSVIFKERALLVFPGKDSKKLDAFTEACGGFQFEKIVFVDSTWHQCYKICQDERMVSLPQVIIDSRETLFWRYQTGKPKEYLSTIEAVYYLCVDFHATVLQKRYEGEYDNLLFLFKFMFEKIHELHADI